MTDTIRLFLISCIIFTQWLGLAKTASGQSCPFSGDTKYNRKTDERDSFNSNRRSELKSDHVPIIDINDTNDKLKQVNDHLFSFHNRERGRRLTQALEKGIVTTCEGKTSLCVLEKEPSGSNKQFPYLPEWDCTSHSMPSTTERYTVTKEMSHIALSTYLLLNPLTDGIEPDLDNHGRVLDYLKDLKDAEKIQVDNSTFPTCPSTFPWSEGCWPDIDLLTNQQNIMTFATSMLDVAARGDPVKRDNLEQFAANTKNLLVNNLNVAVRDRIDNMHNTVMEWISQKLITNYDELVGVACTSHMARNEDLGVQYLARLLSLPAPVDTPNRLIVYEGPDLAGAMNLLATALVDWNAGEAFFKDPARLQRDALADGAKRYLATEQFPGLPPPVHVPASDPDSPRNKSDLNDKASTAYVWAWVFGTLLVLSLIANVLTSIRLVKHDRQFVSAVKMMFRRRRGSEELGQGRILPLLEVD